MRIEDLTRSIEKIAPLDFQEEYDNSGLILGDPAMEVTGVLICLDVTEEVLHEALLKKCNFVVSHHPVIFKGLKRLTGNSLSERLSIMAVKNEIAVYAAHTNLDNADEGLNRHLIMRLGVRDPKVLQTSRGQLFKLVTFAPEAYAGKVRQALFDAGAGHIGKYDWCSYNVDGKGTFRATGDAKPFVGKMNELHIENETRIEVVCPSHIEKQLVDALVKSHPYEEVAYDLYPLNNVYSKRGNGMVGDLENEVPETEFLDRVKKLLGIPVIRHSAFLGQPVKRVAVCGGAGAFLLPEAIRSGAGIFLTGDIRYHDFPDAGKKILLADIGHYESEQGVKELIYSILIEKFPNFAILISEINTNPVNYY
jgi:dinuclear metal center YbgI/SA1388 family protein